MFLASQLPDLLDDLKDSLGAFSIAREPDAQSSTLEAVAEGCVQVGLAALVVDADVERMRRQLTYSGYARRWYLERVAPHAPGDHRRARSRWPSSFAALAAGQVALAREIGALESPVRIASGEYPEEYALALAVGELLVGASKPATRAAVAQSAPEAAAVLDALAARDAEACSAALLGFLDAEGEAARAAKATADAVGDELARRISLVGMAWVQLARSLGLPLAAPDHPRCPRLATELPASPAPDDIIRELRP